MPKKSAKKRPRRLRRHVEDELTKLLFPYYRPNRASKRKKSKKKR